MVDDPNDSNDDDSSSSSSSSSGGGGSFSGGGGGGNLLGLLPLLFGLFRNKWLLAIVVIGAVFFYFKGGCNGTGTTLQDVAKLATGGFLSPREFEKARIYEPLADDEGKNPLPESANLQRFAPAVGNQGKQGSCVAWSSAYGARTILEASRSGEDPNSIKYSPSFMYNQIGLEGCQGTYVEKAMEFMSQQGAVPYNEFPYDENDCSRQPSQQLLSEAGEYRMRGFNRLSQGDRNNVLDLHAIRENLAQGAPVVIGMMVGESFMQPMLGQDLWRPTSDDQQMMGFGGHALCVVGYDDKKYGGAFLIMNSWGKEWGNNGFAWIRYTDFKYFVREAYGLEPMAKTGTAANQLLNAEIGLVRNDDKQYIPLRFQGNNLFQSTTPVAAGTRFKIEVKNSTECYIYVFGQETDGTSYVLFPYPDPNNPSTSKYSPFCGITGYRLFPKNKSMMPDSLGKKDYMAVVMSTDSLNWNELNTALSRSTGDYAYRLNAALGNRQAGNVNFSNTSAGTITFKTTERDKKVVACVIAIDK